MIEGADEPDVCNSRLLNTVRCGRTSKRQVNHPNWLFISPNFAYCRFAIQSEFTYLEPEFCYLGSFAIWQVERSLSEQHVYFSSLV